MPYTGPLVIKHYFINFTVNLQIGATQTTYNIRCIKTYKSDTKVEDSNSKNIIDSVNI